MAPVLQMSQVEFGLRVAAYQREHKLESVILAVYAVVDELNELAIAESGKQFVCRRGCSYCCMQRVCATQLEWAEIEKFLDRKRRLQKLRQHLREATKPWQEYFRKHVRTQLITSTSDALRTQGFGIACPFLQNKSCLIYRVRPIDCRTAFSEAQCGSGQGRKRSSYYPFEFHFHANQVITSAQEQRHGNLTVTPLSEWLDMLLEKRGML